MTGLPLRAKLTLTFAAATVSVLAGAGAFVYARLASDFNEQVTTGLRARSRAAAGLAHDSAAALRTSGIGGFEESRESFALVLTPRGTLTPGWAARIARHWTTRPRHEQRAAPSSSNAARRTSTAPEQRVPCPSVQRIPFVGGAISRLASTTTTQASRRGLA
ncbi:MAG: hypothetical protein ABI611_19830 [Solirubrobacteraceae bacterium]